MRCCQTSPSTTKLLATSYTFHIKCHICYQFQIHTAEKSLLQYIIMCNFLLVRTFACLPAFSPLDFRENLLPFDRWEALSALRDATERSSTRIFARSSSVGANMLFSTSTTIITSIISSVSYYHCGINIMSIIIIINDIYTISLTVFMSFSTDETICT